MVVSGFYDCVSALLKYRSYRKIFSAIALLFVPCISRTFLTNFGAQKPGCGLYMGAAYLWGLISEISRGRFQDCNQVPVYHPLNGEVFTYLHINH